MKKLAYTYYSIILAAIFTTSLATANGRSTLFTFTSSLTIAYASLKQSLNNALSRLQKTLKSSKIYQTMIAQDTTKKLRLPGKSDVIQDNGVAELARQKKEENFKNIDNEHNRQQTQAAAHGINPMTFTSQVLNNNYDSVPIFDSSQLSYIKALVQTPQGRLQALQKNIALWLAVT